MTLVDWFEFEVDEDMGQSEIENESEVLASSNKKMHDACDGSGGAIEDHRDAFTTFLLFIKFRILKFTNTSIHPYRQ